MAITEDARIPYNGSVSGDIHTFPITVGASANFLVVKFGWESSRLIVDVKIGDVASGASGTSLTFDATSARVQGASRSEIWYLVAPPTGSKEIWIDQSASGVMAAEAVTLLGVDQINPVADSDGGVAVSTTSVTAASALVPDGTCWLEVVACDGSGTGTYTWGGSITGSATQDVGAYMFVAGFQPDVASNVTPSVARDQAGNLDWALSAVLLKAAASAPRKFILSTPAA
jgi:hypothetical protein